MAIYLIRHPRPAVPAGLCYGRLDVPLADLPAAAAAGLVRCVPAGLPVVTSPAHRCLAFARALAPAVTVDDRLQEMDFGMWEGRAWDALPRSEIDAWAADPAGFTPPGGESAQAVQARALAAVADLPEAALVITHGGVIRVLLAALLGILPEHWAEIRPPFAGGYAVTLDVRRQWTPGSAIVAPC